MKGMLHENEYKGADFASSKKITGLKAAGLFKKAFKMRAVLRTVRDLN